MVRRRLTILEKITLQGLIFLEKYVIIYFVKA